MSTTVPKRFRPGKPGYVRIEIPLKNGESKSVTIHSLARRQLVGAVKAVRLDSQDLVLLQDASGKIYSTSKHMMGRTLYAGGFGQFGWVESHLHCLVLLGAMTAADVRWYLAEGRRRESQYEKSRVADSIREDCKKLGIRAPKGLPAKKKS